MARQHLSSMLMVVCVLASILAGLAGRQQADSEGSPTVFLTTLLSQASDCASVVREKLTEFAGCEDSLFPQIGTGMLVATLAVCTLYGLSRFFDPHPFLYNGGKMGKLEAQSIYSAKKNC